MSVIYWNDNSDVQIQASYIFFYAASTAEILPDVGVWLFLPDNEQMVQWHDYIDTQFSGDIRPVWPVATAGVAVAEIIRARNFHRLQFGGAFGRIN